MNSITLSEQMETLRSYYKTGATRAHAFRRQQLDKLKKAILHHEEELYAALYADLKKNKEEVWVTETGFVISEINAALRHLHRWMQPLKTKTNLLNFPSKSFVMHEPLGVVLIIGP